MVKMQMQKCIFTTRLIFRVKKNEGGLPFRRGFLVFRPKACCCNPLGARTQDPHIKSVMLYQLS